MPLNLGSFTRLFRWVDDRNSSILISAQRMDQEMDGMAAALSKAMYVDGQSTVTANIPMSNFKFTSVGDATLDQDGLNRRSGDARFVRQIGGGSMTDPVLVVDSEIDCKLGNYFYKTVSAILTWTFIDPPAVGVFGFALELTNGGLAAQTWPASVKWPGGSPPALTTSGVDLLVFITRNGGVTWRGALVQRNSS